MAKKSHIPLILLYRIVKLGYSLIILMTIPIMEVKPCFCAVSVFLFFAASRVYVPPMLLGQHLVTFHRFLNNLHLANVVYHRIRRTAGTCYVNKRKHIFLWIVFHSLAHCFVGIVVRHLRKSF